MSASASYQIRQARTDFCDIVEEVETKGRHVTITNHGRPVARIVPMADGGPDEDVQKWIAELRDVREKGLVS